tara:strand:- start:92 stop:214 length:123 start_codon:yes stop_codon:yes gene_type:complete
VPISLRILNIEWTKKTYNYHKTEEDLDLLLAGKVTLEKVD